MNAMMRPESESAMLLGRLLQDVSVVEDPPAGLADMPVQGITMDSRQVTPGDLFIAIPGRDGDGRRYAAEALASGAVGVVYEKSGAPEECKRLSRAGRAIAVADLRRQVGPVAARYFGEPSESLQVIGVTGTNGKTTCAWLLAQAMEQLGERCAIMGTVGDGFPNSLEASGLTTADPITIQRNLRRWLDLGATTVCMEVSSHGLDQGRVEGIRFQVAIFTNLTRDHLDYHGDMAQYSDAKKRLFRSPGLKAVVVNSDDPVGREILQFSSGLRSLSFGINAGDLSLGDVELSADGTNFTWSWQGRHHPCRTSLIGAVNLPNLLAVIGALLVQDYPPDRIAEIIRDLKPPPGRMEPVGGDADQPTVMVDYAHTPDSLERALESLRALTKGRLIVVFGCGGDRDRGKRFEMGAVAGRLADDVVITNDNPRGEDPFEIASTAQDGVMAVDPKKRCRIELDRSTAIGLAVSSGGPGDVVLIAGKGHEATQIIGDRVTRFDDRDIAKAALEAIR